jgi:hypothetical protein
MKILTTLLASVALITARAEIINFDNQQAGNAATG